MQQQQYRHATSSTMTSTLYKVRIAYNNNEEGHKTSFIPRLITMTSWCGVSEPRSIIIIIIIIIVPGSVVNVSFIPFLDAATTTTSPILYFLGKGRKKKGYPTNQRESIVVPIPRHPVLAILENGSRWSLCCSC